MSTVSVDQQVCCRVLGPLELVVDDVPVAVGGGMSRRLLAALVLAEGQAVPDGQLAEMLWPGESSVRALRMLVWRLRNALGVVGERLERTAVGYRFALEVEATDQHRFGAAIASGLELLASGDGAGAVVELQAAVELWRGEPWQELGESTVVIGARARLTELYELAREELEAAHLAVGDPVLAVSSLTQLVADSPYRERRWELLAMALCDAGRPDEAAAELRRFRALLADNLGLDPSAALTALERRLGPAPAPVRQPNRRDRRWR
ncbi:AfsR/SARP family transcriptional regulator [Kribbella sp. NPDC055071]